MNPFSAKINSKDGYDNASREERREVIHTACLEGFLPRSVSLWKYYNADVWYWDSFYSYAVERVIRRYEG